MTVRKLNKSVKLGLVLIFYSVNLSLRNITKLSRGSDVYAFGISQR